MSGRRLRLALVALLAAVAAAAAGQQDPPPVWFVSPPVLEPAIGEVVVEVEVDHPEARQVLFLVDGREAGLLSRPPYRQLVTLREGLGSHRFEAVVLGPAGELFRVARTTPGLRVDEEVDLGLRQLPVRRAG